jgi:hypothetical protein
VLEFVLGVLIFKQVLFSNNLNRRTSVGKPGGIFDFMRGLIFFLFSRLLVQALFLISSSRYLFREAFKVPVEFVLDDGGEFLLALETAEDLFSWLEDTYRASVTF